MKQRGFNKFWIITMLIMVMLVSGCGAVDNSTPNTHFYTLEYSPPISQPLDGDQATDTVIRIDRFSAAPCYDTDHIVYRENDFERENYFYHRWRARPADLVSYFLSRDLRAAHVASVVLTADSTQVSTHLMQGVVEEFLEWDDAAGWQAVLSLNITLLRTKEVDLSRQLVFQKTFSVRKGCASKDPQAVVAAMSAAMADVSKQIIVSLRKQLATR